MASEPSGKGKQLQIILDSSFLLTLLRQHRDPIAETRTLIRGTSRIVTLDLVVYELEKLARKGPSTRAAFANACTAFLSKRNVPILEHKPGPTEVDMALVSFALTEKNPTAIATVDGELRSVLRANGVPAIWPRKGHGLMSDALGF